MQGPIPLIPDTRVTQSFTVSDFDYDLPPELIAQTPAAERTGSRLLHLDVLAEEGAISPEDLELFCTVDDPQEAWNQIRRFYNL